MTDLKRLFHDPDSLEDHELLAVRSKLKWQMRMPYVSAAFSGALFHVWSNQMFRTGFIPIRVGGAAFAGFMLGGFASSQMNRSVLSAPVDKDIMHAFETRYLNHSLNVSGFNNNYISENSNADNSVMRRPY